MSIEERLEELGIVLPEKTPPAAAYIPGVKIGEWIYTAGQTPKVDGKLQYTGRIGRDVSLEEGQAAARLCAINCLSIVQRLAGSLDNVERIVKLTGFVNSDDDFFAQPQVINGASLLLEEIFGEKGTHARSAVGCSVLPGNACCEIEMVVKLK